MGGWAQHSYEQAPTERSCRRVPSMQDWGERWPAHHQRAVCSRIHVEANLQPHACQEAGSAPLQGCVPRRLQEAGERIIQLC